MGYEYQNRRCYIYLHWLNSTSKWVLYVTNMLNWKIQDTDSECRIYRCFNIRVKNALLHQEPQILSIFAYWILLAISTEMKSCERLWNFDQVINRYICESATVSSLVPETDRHLALKTMLLLRLLLLLLLLLLLMMMMPTTIMMTMIKSAKELILLLDFGSPT